MKRMYSIILLLLMMVVVTEAQGQVTYDNKVMGTKHKYRTNNSDYKRGKVQQQQQVVITPGTEYQSSRRDRDEIIAMELESKYYGKKQSGYNMAIQYRGSRVLVVDESSRDMVRTYESDNLVVYATNENMTKMKYIEEDELGRNIRTEIYDILYYQENVDSYEVVLRTDAGTIFSIVLPRRGSVVTLTFKGLIYLITGNIEYNAYLKE